MHAADAEAPGPPRIETVVEFWSGVEAAARMQAAARMEAAARMQAAVDNCPERVHLAALYRF